MLGILGEDASDSATLKQLVKRIIAPRTISIRTRDCDGCGDIFRRGGRLLELMHAQGCRKFIVCCDADGASPVANMVRMQNEVLNRVTFASTVRLIVPVQELEAWLLADVQKVTRFMSSWIPRSVSHPEHIASPKEHIKRLSAINGRRPIYSPTVHNPTLAEHVDCAIIDSKCPSFRPFHAFAKAL